MPNTLRDALQPPASHRHGTVRVTVTTRPIFSPPVSEPPAARSLQYKAAGGHEALQQHSDAPPAPRQHHQHHQHHQLHQLHASTLHPAGNRS